MLDDKIKVPMKIYEDLFHVDSNYDELKLDISVVINTFIKDKNIDIMIEKLEEKALNKNFLKNNKVMLDLL